MLKVIGIGDNVCDKYMHSMIMYPGGQAMNFSVYAKMLGADSAYLGVFGSDKVAAHIIKTLDTLAVDHTRCRQYEGENGYAKIKLVNGDRHFIMSNRGGIINTFPLDLTEEDLNYIKGFQLVHTSNNGHLNSQLSKVYQTGVPISYDFSGQWNRQELVREVAPYITYAFLSCGECPQEEIQSICVQIISYGCKLVVATRGSQGAMVYDGNTILMQPPKLVKAIDTLGAGDSFATVFLLSLTNSLNEKKSEIEADSAVYKQELKNAMVRGAEFASKTCMTYGAFGFGVAFDDDESL